MTQSQQASPFPALASQKYMLLTTFRKSGQPVPTPVWFTEHNGKVYVYTQPNAGKIKRVRANGRAELAPSDARGTILGPSTAGRARLLPPEDASWAYALFTRKYGLFFRMFALVGWIRRTTAAYLEITPADG